MHGKAAVGDNSSAIIMAGVTRGRGAGDDDGGLKQSTDEVAMGEGGSRVGIEKMYNIYERISSAEHKTQLEDEFLELLKAVDGTEKEKRLASQFITKHLEHFPKLQGEALDALLNLCEDENVSIRKQVEKDLVTVCKKLPNVVPKIADVFSQLMQTDDSGELSQLQACLVSLFHIRAESAIEGMYAQIKDGEPVVRDRCFKFLQTKLNELGPEIINNAFGTRLLTETRRILPYLDGVDFKVALGLLDSMKIKATLLGLQQDIVNMVGDLLNLNADFEPDIQNVHRLLVCTDYIIPFFGRVQPPLISSTPYAIYYCTRVLPRIADIASQDADKNLCHAILRFMAELTYHMREIDLAEAKNCLNGVYKEILRFIVIPSAEEIPNPKYDFSSIECLLFVLHKMSMECPEFFEEDVAKLKNVRARLKYLGRSTQSYTIKLRKDLQARKREDLKQPEIRLKINALKTLANIMEVIKDVFLHPPRYNADILSVSWKPLVCPRKKISPSVVDGGTPRSHHRRPREESMEIYQPPKRRLSGRVTHCNSSSGERNPRRLSRHEDLRNYMRQGQDECRRSFHYHDGDWGFYVKR